MTTYQYAHADPDYWIVELPSEYGNHQAVPVLWIRHPFVPSDKGDRERRCEEILSIQALGLKKRLEHTGCTSAVVGISGGLDSTLALAGDRQSI